MIALLQFFGITVDSFRVGGGILLLLMAIAMLHAKISQVKQTREEENESMIKESVAIVPLAIPLLAGPGRRRSRSHSRAEQRGFRAAGVGRSPGTCGSGR